MARKNAKIILEPFRTTHDHSGSRHCAVVKLSRKSGWHNPIGRICETSKGYVHTSANGAHAMRGPMKTKAAAVKALVKDWRRWVGTATYDID